MDGLVKKVVFVLLAAALVFGGYFYSRSRPASNAREQVIAELQTFPRFAQHRALLLAALDAAHEKAASRLTNRHGSRRMRLYDIDEQAYRSEVYTAMAAALSQAGHDDAAEALLRHQVSVKR